jgi:hypothetical protein
MSTITSVWSAYGHRFLPDGGEDTETCLTCGAMYQLVPDPDDPTSGTYQAADGDQPRECSGDTGLVHGYPGERYCHDCSEPGCVHTDHECNCLQCT